ncbi:HNH endonuclease signature motif containing protein [Vannielia litorea]|uniref:HNH endonuclease n=1 Tax=Vannielia litorea TaxID=1217970 RepID=A0A1N6GNA9_9RHOB|nr:HNH endonuclease signature motif containing protein [Vannielia litorea]SIO08932.1 HNH endonuclease [Vannielia litorea]
MTISMKGNYSSDLTSLPQLDIDLPPMPEKPGGARQTHVFTTKTPAFYRPVDLKKQGPITPRIRHFETLLTEIWRDMGERPVPYAFRTRDGKIRSMDAGCLARLLKQSPPSIKLVLDDAQGVILAAEPIPRGTGDALLGFRLTDTPDPDLKALSKRTIRLGARPFRADAFRHWGDACVLTGTRIRRALDAAHIFRYGGEATNATHNCLLLRADVHRLFDAHLISFNYSGEDLQFHVSPDLHGTEYEGIARIRIPAPRLPRPRPHPEAVAFHFATFTRQEHAR